MGILSQVGNTSALAAQALSKLTTGHHDGMTKRCDAFVGHLGMDASIKNSGEAHDSGALHSRNRLLNSAITYERLIPFGPAGLYMGTSKNRKFRFLRYCKMLISLD